MTDVLRPDLDPLDPEALAALTNRGLVKRATKELDAGALLESVQRADGTLEGAFADGARAEIPPAGLGAASCTCGATGACRHVLALVLGYLRAVATDGSAGQAWSPSQTDDELRTRYGAAALRRADTVQRTGIDAIVRRGTKPSVELPTATVTFLSAADPALVVCDAVPSDVPHLVCLAVRAFRMADVENPEGERVVVELRGAGPRQDFVPSALIVGLAERLLSTGTADADPILVATVRASAADARRAGHVWIADVCEDLVAQLEAHAERSAVHDPLRTARLLVELWARCTAAARPGAAIARVAGADTVGETRLRAVSLTGLGARVDVADGVVRADVYLAHGDEVLVAGQSWRPAVGEAMRGADVAERRLAGSRVRSLAVSTVLSESVTRRANGRVSFGRPRAGATSVLPAADGWDRLSAGFVFDRVATLRGHLEARPMSLVRLRLLAGDLVVFRAARARTVGYAAGSQTHRVELDDADGAVLRVESRYRVEVPGALPALSAAVTAAGDDPVQVAGFVRLRGDDVVMDPMTVRSSAGMVVLDLAEGPAGTFLDPIAAEQSEDGPLVRAFEVLAEAAHTGLRRAGAGHAARVAAAACDLRSSGYAIAAADVAACADDRRPTAWLRAAALIIALQES